MGGSDWSSWVRARPAGVILGVGAAVAAAMYTILTVLETPAWTRILATAVVAVIGSAVVLEKWYTDRRGKKEAEEEKQRAKDVEEAQWLRDVKHSLAMWPAPAVCDIDPYALGVNRSQLAESRSPHGELPPYVVRDIDELARKRLQKHGLVLLIGAPASGVTSTAYQLASIVPTALVLVPEAPDGLKTAIGKHDVLSRVESAPRIVLWLDRVDMFDGNGLPAAMLRRCRERPGLRVVATIPSTEYAVWETNNPSVAREFGEPVELGRFLSAEETQRAEETYPGVDFSEGIAAAFTSTANLLKRLRGGAPGCPFEPDGDACALSRAAVDVAIDWATTDIRRPLPIDRVPALAAKRLNRRQTTDPAHVDWALKWATAPIIGGSSLLTLVTDDQGSKAIAAHPAIVELRRAETSAAPADAVWQAALDTAGDADDSEAVGRVGFRAHVDGNMGVAAQAWARVTVISEPATEWLRRAAEFSRGRQNPAATLIPERRLLELTEAAFGPDSPNTTVCLTNLGNTRFALGQPGKARELFERVLSILERKYGPDDPEVAKTLGNLGNTRLALGQPDQARELFERALRILEGEHGPNHPEVAKTLNNLGGARLKLGQPDQARELFERALRIQEQEYGPTHLNVVPAVNNLGVAWRDLEQPGKSRDQHERALLIQEREYGPRHPEVAKTLYHLGVASVELGEADNARKLFERALRIQEREYGPTHLEVASTVCSLGVAWAHLGQPGKARDLYERALRIAEGEYGRNHLNVAQTVSNLGSAWAELGQTGKARELFERTLRIQEREYGRNHLKVATTLSNLGVAWAELGKTGKARELFERALRILHEHYPGGHPLTRSVADKIRTITPDVIVLDDGRIISRAVDGDENS